MVANCSGGIEPAFALSFVKQNILGGMTLDYGTHPLLEKALREEGFYREDILARIHKEGSVQSIPELPAWIRETFVCAMDLTPDQHVWMQAAWQERNDNAISKVRVSPVLFGDDADC